ncbi:MAG: proton-conducting transporter membrane subunit [Metallosphaera sp.]
MIGLYVIAGLTLIPLVSSAFVFKERYASVVSSSLTLLLALLLRFNLPFINSEFYVTNFSWYFIVMVTSIYLLSTIYSLFYFNFKNKIEERNYFYFMNMFAASMLFTLTVNNLGLMWVGLEATTVSSVLLVTIEGTPSALEAGWRYLILVSSGVTFAFISVILFYYGLHNLTLSSILYPHYSPLFTLASAVALIGFGTKAGVFPVNTWLPDAHSEAPAPVSALFSGVLLPVAVYILHDVFIIAPLPELYSWLAVVSILIASIMISSQRYYKRMFAYSTIENMNLAILGIATGSETGILILLFTHAFAKAGAFYSSGVILKSIGSKEINEYGLLGNPIMAASLLLSSLGVTGAPPFGNFIGEFIILTSTIKAGLIAQFVVVIISLAIAFISINYHVSRIIFKEGEKLNEDKGLSTIALISSLIPLSIGVALVIL